jgi:hypothetical protein
MTALDKIRKIRHNLERYQATLPDVVLESVYQNEGQILDLVRDDQLTAQGIDGSGKAIRPKYTAFTKSIKRDKGQVTSHVTLRDTGETQDTMLMEYGSDYFYPVATTPQVDGLLRKYGNRIFDLTQKSISEAARIMRPDIVRKSLKMILN